MTSNNEESKHKNQIDEIYESMGETVEYRQILKRLSPMVKAIGASTNAQKLLKPYVSKLKDRLSKSGRRMKLFKEDSAARDTGELVTLRKAFVYLGLFESTVVNMLDIILMIFIVNGHDFFIYQQRKYAKTLDGLDHATVSEKLTFLNHHKFTIFSKMLNKSLRNKVAHLDFDVESSGKISIKGQSYDLEDEITKLMAFVLLVYKVLEDCNIPKILTTLSQE